MSGTSSVIACLIIENSSKVEQAEASYQKALAIYRKVVGNNHPHTARTLHNLAILSWEQGKYERYSPANR